MGEVVIWIERSPNRDKAFEIYKDYDGDIKLIDIAKELNIKYF
ncbi:hypothetical protein CYK66_08270 [Clostridium perfringens]|nr:hypothetical protein CYK66_08270 [Clostridium perfringens]